MPTSSPDDLPSRIRAELLELHRERNNLQQRLQVVDALIENNQRLLHPVPEDTTSRSRARQRRTDVLVAYLRERDGATLADLIEAARTALPGDLGISRAAITDILRMSDQFENVTHGVWRLKQVPQPPPSKQPVAQATHIVPTSLLAPPPDRPKPRDPLTDAAAVIAAMALGSTLTSSAAWKAGTTLLTGKPREVKR
jgi:hypothetical protein